MKRTLKNKLITTSVLFSVIFGGVFATSTINSNSNVETMNLNSTTRGITDQSVNDFQTSYRNSGALVTQDGNQQLYIWGDVTSGFNIIPYDPAIALQGHSVYPHLVEFDGFDMNQATQFALGESHAGLVFKDETGQERLYTWGNNDEGQLGIENGGVNEEFPVEVVVPEWEGMTFVDVVFGGKTSFAILNDGTSDHIYSWGSNSVGQLGLGETVTQTNVPTEITFPGIGDYTFQNMDTTQWFSSGGSENRSSSIVLESGGKDYAFVMGKNFQGKFGIEDAANNDFIDQLITTPTDITNGGVEGNIVNFDLSSASAGDSILLIEKSNGEDEVLMSGSGDNGVFGIPGSMDDYSTFQTVFTTEGTEWSDIIWADYGDQASFVVAEKADGLHLLGAGWNGWGNISTDSNGIATQEYFDEFTEIDLPFDIENALWMNTTLNAVSIGVEENGKEEVYTWGSNWFRTLGTGTEEEYDGRIQKLEFVDHIPPVPTLPEAEKPFPWWVVYLSITLVLVGAMGYLFWEMHKDHDDKHEHHWFHIGRH